jgi:hypothetical protein
MGISSRGKRFMPQSALTIFYKFMEYAAPVWQGAAKSHLDIIIIINISQGPLVFLNLCLFFTVFLVNNHYPL